MGIFKRPVQYRLASLIDLARQAYGNCRDAPPPTAPAYVLHTLDLTLHGYCVRRRFGWERAEEYVLSSRPPPFWRRGWRAAPLLALTVRIGQDGSRLLLAAAPAQAAASRAALLWRLPPAAQQQLQELQHAILKKAAGINTASETAI